MTPCCLPGAAFCCVLGCRVVRLFHLCQSSFLSLVVPSVHLNPCYWLNISYSLGFGGRWHRLKADISSDWDLIIFIIVVIIIAPAITVIATMPTLGSCGLHLIKAAAFVTIHSFFSCQAWMCNDTTPAPHVKFALSPVASHNPDWGVHPVLIYTLPPIFILEVLPMPASEFSLIKQLQVWRLTLWFSNSVKVGLHRPTL